MGEEEIGFEELRKVIKEIKVGKAMGVDEIPGEAWKYGGEEVEKWVWRFCNRIWKREGWKEGLIVPIVKKSEGDRVEEYKGVTITSTLYKVYAKVLAERLRKEVEEKGIMPRYQTGFREGLDTMNNIYVLNYLINRELGRKKGRMVALFIDLKVAFDSVNRRILIETMRERGIREGLIKRVEEVLGETSCRVKVGRVIGERFWTRRGARQGCPLSPLLFNILMADMEEELEKEVGRSKIRGKEGIVLGIRG